MTRKKSKKGGELSQRHARVGEVIRASVADILLHGLNHPAGLVSVMEVRVNRDLRNADVYMSFFGSDEERAASREAVQKAWGRISRETAARVELRYMPKLHLRVDTTMDHADHINRLLKEAGVGPLEDENAGDSAEEEETGE